MVMQIEQNRKTALKKKVHAGIVPGHHQRMTLVLRQTILVTQATALTEVAGIPVKPTGQRYRRVDTVKTDGKYIYAISRADLVVVKSGQQPRLMKLAHHNRRLANGLFPEG